MKTIYAITLLTYKEGLRYRILYGTLVLSILLMFFSISISGLFLRENSKIILDFCLSAVSIGGLLVPFFLAINLLAKDIEQRTVVSILSRSVSRTQYILGKFGGITLLTGTVMAILCVTTLLSIYAGKQVLGAHYFVHFSAPAVIVSIMMNFLGITILNALVVLWCSVTTSSFLATLLTLFTYLIGHTVDDMVQFLATSMGAEVITSVRYTVQAAQYIFPNLAAFDLKLLAAHGLMLPAAEISLLIIYAAGYISAVLALAILAFGRRDLH